ncbi:dihydrodipicolinate synthase family protein [Desulfuromonas versatilis]|uniref:Dihydrodipicolinate synthase family protein n=1 Tax=Desulfuromonas versatilis TaxID=2802975 RepID=A0ABM8HXH7_9BACT|nr:dihydrodipicolinate synthase family protein [Desulfuromonas versatilis]BCR06675.1 dihydrodipicolinate synthase family protein [Desulfuromonas versatilis]
MTKTTRFTGVFPILATPFDDNENLDLDSFARLIRFMARLGVNGVTILGVLGEANRMTDAERQAAIETAVAAADGRLPVVVGASHRGTRAALELSRMAERLGADAVMLTPAQEPVPSEERIFEYFARVADGMELPIVVQDHPASTGVHMAAPLLVRLAREIPRVACFKEEAVPTAPKIRALIEGLGERRVPILTGLGALYGIFDLQAGSDGFMTGFAFPEVLQAMVRAMAGGRPEQADQLYRRFLPLIVFEQQPGVAVRKEILRRRGLIAGGKVRHPGGGLNPHAAAQLDQLLQQLLPGVDLGAPLQL